MRLQNDRGEPFMGIGLLRLLQEVETEHSLARAARKLGLSYAKALRILSRLERKLGRRLVRRHKGGAEHGGADLTEAGERFLRAFERLHEAIETAGHAAFRAFCKSLERKERK